MRNILYKIVRNYTRFFVDFCVSVVCWVIFLVTYEPFTWKKVTKRKIRRIKKLTKFKCWVFKHMPKTLKYLNYYNYLGKINNRYGV